MAEMLVGDDYLLLFVAGRFVDCICVFLQEECEMRDGDWKRWCEEVGSDGGERVEFEDYHY